MREVLLGSGFGGWEVVKKMITTQRRKIIFFMRFVSEQGKPLKPSRQIYHWLSFKRQIYLLLIIFTSSSKQTPPRRWFEQTKARHQDHDCFERLEEFHMSPDYYFLPDFHYKANHLCYGCLVLSLSSNSFHLGTHQKG